MKKIISLLILIMPLALFAQQDSVISRAYDWTIPSDSLNQSSEPLLPIWVTGVLFKGSTPDMQRLEMTENILIYKKKELSLKAPANEEQLLIIKSGALLITVKDSSWNVAAGSVALIMPGEKYRLINPVLDPCQFYLLKYTSKSPADITRGKTAGGSFVIDWNKIVFKPHDKGGIRNFFERPTAMTKRMEMHVSTLNVGLKSHDPHQHRAAEIVIVVSGKTEMQIADKFYKGSAGTVYYLGSNILHAIRNDGAEPCTYFAFQLE